MKTAELLQKCSDNINSLNMDESDLKHLKEWAAEIESYTQSATEQFLAQPVEEWQQLILQHSASNHVWYEYIADRITIDEMAVFLLENRYYPVFLKLLEVIEKIQICDDACLAVKENIADEHHPVPHADLMGRMMLAVKSRAGADLQLDIYPSLVDRTLVFYYGYYIQPWHLVGSVFATERMGTRRVACMHKGLQRLGLNADELAFTTIHSSCDDHHANDWLERVIIPSISLNAFIRVSIAKGLAVCLETSKIYLDYLMQRVINQKPG